MLCEYWRYLQNASRCCWWSPRIIRAGLSCGSVNTAGQQRVRLISTRLIRRLPTAHFHFKDDNALTHTHPRHSYYHPPMWTVEPLIIYLICIFDLKRRAGCTKRARVADTLNTRLGSAETAKQQTVWVNIGIILSPTTPSARSHVLAHWLCTRPNIYKLRNWLKSKTFFDKAKCDIHKFQ